MSDDLILGLIFWAFVLWVCWRLFLRKWVHGLSATKLAKAKIMAHQIPEEVYYEQAAHEVSSGNIRPGLWAKAWSESGGDNTKAQALYLKLRVSAMRSEAASKMHSYSHNEPSTSNGSEQYTSTEKTIIPCPNCLQKLRVDSGKFIEVECPKCRLTFDKQT